MKTRKVMMLLLLIAATIVLCACESSVSLANEDGEMWQYQGAELVPGIYKKNGAYYNPLLPYGTTFTSPETKQTKDRVVWLYQYRNLIPVFDNKENLLIQYSPETYPTKPIIMEHFTSQGYSLGALFYKDGTELRFPEESADSVCPNSSIYNAMRAEVRDSANTRIVELNEDTFPLQLVNGAGYIMGLSKDGAYKIGFYEGTRFREFVVKADTEIFLQDAAYTITEREPTKEGYFIIKMLPEMPNGLYCVNGTSLIYYTGSAYDAVPTEAPEPTSEPTPSPEVIVDTIDSTPAQEVTPTNNVIIMEEVS